MDEAALCCHTDTWHSPVVRPLRHIDERGPAPEASSGGGGHGRHFPVAPDLPRAGGDTGCGGESGVRQPYGGPQGYAEGRDIRFLRDTAGHLQRGAAVPCPAFRAVYEHGLSAGGHVELPAAGDDGDACGWGGATRGVAEEGLHGRGADGFDTACGVRHAPHRQSVGELQGVPDDGDYTGHHSIPCAGAHLVPDRARVGGGHGAQLDAQGWRERAEGPGRQDAALHFPLQPVGIGGEPDNVRADAFPAVGQLAAADAFHGAADFRRPVCRRVYFGLHRRPAAFDGRHGCVRGLVLLAGRFFVPGGEHAAGADGDKQSLPYPPLLFGLPRHSDIRQRTGALLAAAMRAAMFRRGVACGRLYVQPPLQAIRKGAGMMRRLSRNLQDVWEVFSAEVRRIFSDRLVMLVFFVATIIYPLIFCFIYLNEVVVDLPVAVVDESGSEASKRFVHKIDATPEIMVKYRVLTMAEAEELMRDHEVHAVFYIPRDYGTRIARMETARVGVFADMSSFLYYKNALMGGSNVLIDEMHTIELERYGMAQSPIPNPQSPIEIFYLIINLINILFINLY